MAQRCGVIFPPNTRYAVLTLAGVKFYGWNMEFIIGILGFLLIVGILLARKERRQVEHARRADRDIGEKPGTRD
jgi:hypothetical protein